MSADDIKENYREVAEQRVKLRLALEKIAEKEGFTEVTDEDVEAEYNKLAEAYKMEADKVKELIPAEALKKDIAVEKAMDFVKESAIKE
jgi:trigger factor